MRLLPPECHLSGHDALSFGDQDAFLAKTVAETAVTLVTLGEEKMEMGWGGERKKRNGW